MPASSCGRSSYLHRVPVPPPAPDEGARNDPRNDECDPPMTVRVENLRNVAIIAHVDHGKTTLVDQLLRQSGTLATRGEQAERVMDSNDIARERGSTILDKKTSDRKSAGKGK